MYQKVSTNLNFVDREKETEKFWRENDIFQKSMKAREGCPTYTFYDGPPTANGKPHIGHVLTRVIKDMIPRYRTMKGYMVPRKAGWDTHGLPVELEVEKMLGLNGKEQIEEYGIEPFIEKCKESVWKYKGMWEDFSGTVGFWADMDNPYVTYDDNFIESEWWALNQIWNKGLLYKGFKIVPYCPRCGTPLSTAEVSQGYKTVKERSAIVRFKVTGEDAYFLAWTTTPWTLPSNVALCVNPDEEYVKVKAADGYTYYMAKALLDTVLSSRLANEENGNKAYEILETYKGKDLEYKEYEPLYACAKETADKQNKKGFFVTCDSYVTMSDGTGIVHIAPAFGEDDANVGRNYDLPFVQFVDGKGQLTEETPYAGKFVKDADKDVLIDLDKEGKLFDAPKFEHEYPHCWRCDTPLIYYARESWYIKETAVRDDLIRNNNTVNWIPESIGKGRFGNWLENIQDWAISRNRYWGTPLNIWECEGCGHLESIGSRAELAERSGNPDDAKVELHRPYIDAVTFTCPDCGKTMKRVPEVIDCWFDSGAMPFAQHHYPFENKEVFKSLVYFIFENIFNKDIVFPDILLRDYARLIIEQYLMEYPDELQEYDLERIKPPYKSIPIPDIKDEKYSDKIYEKGLSWIQHSMRFEGIGMYGDFGRYVFQSALRDFEVDGYKIFNYAMYYIINELGYSGELFDDYDTSMFRLTYDRHYVLKTERIGKKYQWISMYNILARVSDYCVMKSVGSMEEDVSYEGPWNPYVRDFDPTLNEHNLVCEDVPFFVEVKEHMMNEIQEITC